MHSFHEEADRSHLLHGPVVDADPPHERDVLELGDPVLRLSEKLNFLVEVGQGGAAVDLVVLGIRD